MKRIERSVLLAGLLALGLPACSTTSTSDSAGTSSSSRISESGSMGSTGSSGAGGASAAGGSADQSASMASTPNSTVTGIEVVPRLATSQASAGPVAGAAVSAAAGGMSADRVYRITMRLDNGETQTITQETTPTFTTGDRVRLSNGGITP